MFHTCMGNLSITLFLGMHYQENRFTKCNMCSILKDEKQMNPSQKRAVQGLLDKHNKLQK